MQYLRSAVGGLGHFASINGQGAASTVSLTWIRSVSVTSAIGRLLESRGISSSGAFLLAPLVALVCLALARQLYRQHGIAMLPAAGEIASGGNALEGLVALEWTGLMVIWLVFGPEVSRRHMYVLLLMDVIAVALLVASRGRQRIVLMAGLLVCQAGLRIPSGPGFGILAAAFNWVGGASWGLLVYYGTLLSAGFVWLRGGSGVPVPEVPPAMRTGDLWGDRPLGPVGYSTPLARP
jgi:hypothetical protein